MRDLVKSFLTDEFPAAGFLHRDRQVLSHRKIREHGQILVDDLHAGLNGLLGRKFRIFFAVDLDRSGIRRIESGNDIDDRRLSAAVLACQAVYFTLLNDKVYSVQCLDTAEIFLDPCYFNDVLRHTQTLQFSAMLFSFRASPFQKEVPAPAYNRSRNLVYFT